MIRLVSPCSSWSRRLAWLPCHSYSEGPALSTDQACACIPYDSTQAGHLPTNLRYYHRMSASTLATLCKSSGSFWSFKLYPMSYPSWEQSYVQSHLCSWTMACCNRCKRKADVRNRLPWYGHRATNMHSCRTNYLVSCFDCEWLQVTQPLVWRSLTSSS